MIDLKRCGGPSGEEKPIDEFYVKDSTKGTRQSYCKTCFSDRHKRYYRSNKTYYAEKRDKLRAALVEDIAALKNKPCADCGKPYPHYVMDFDHVDPLAKGGGISELAHAGLRSKALEEIKKCAVVCSNCHRTRTWNRAHGGCSQEVRR